MLTQEYLKTILDYNQETGDLIWKYRENVPKQWNTRYAGMVAGCLKEGGYICLTINGGYELAHRIIWMIVYGYMPVEIDHEDGIGSNNKLINLRDATRSQNMANIESVGFGLWERNGKYRASVKVNNERVHLGWYDTKEQAKAAYLAARDKYFGEFAFENRKCL